MLFIYVTHICREKERFSAKNWLMQFGVRETGPESTGQAMREPAR